MSKTFEATAEGLVEFVKDCLASPNILYMGWDWRIFDRQRAGR